MIFITLGTQDKPFDRLLKEVEKNIDNGTITEKVIVQAGCTKYKTDKMEIFDLCSIDELSKYISECSLLITHGGVGSIVEGLKNKKPVIAAPRLAKYGEHINDHQIQIINNFDKEGYIIGLNDMNELTEAIIRSKNFKPKKYKSNTSNMIKLLEELIEK